MTDIVLEGIRAVIVGVVFAHLCLIGGKENIRRQPGWSYVLIGFGLVLFGIIIDITDNFHSLNKYVVIGDTPSQAFLEKVVGYLFGFVLLAIGFWKWLPTVITLRKTQRELKESRDRMELRVKERTADLEVLNHELQDKIVAHKRAEEELRRSEEKYRTLFGNAADLIAVIDTTGNILKEIGNTTPTCPKNGSNRHLSWRCGT